MSKKHAPLIVFKDLRGEIVRIFILMKALHTRVSKCFKDKMHQSSSQKLLCPLELYTNVLYNPAAVLRSCVVDPCTESHYIHALFIPYFVVPYYEFVDFTSLHFEDSVCSCISIFTNLQLSIMYM